MDYYNEFDPKAATWLRELIKQGLIPEGEVDERSIEDIVPRDLVGYRRHHFFAGIGGWAYALALARWPDNLPVWTGSCPCQPFSAAGQGAGFDDQRHLWPAWQHLIAQCRPARIYGEQVASKAVDPWVDLVFDDLEALDYACAAVAYPAAGIGSPHIRDRTYWMADTDFIAGRQGRSIDGRRDSRSNAQSRPGPWGGSESNGLANTHSTEPQQLAREGARPGEAKSRRSHGQSSGRGDASGMEHAHSGGHRSQENAAGDRQSKADRSANINSGPGVSSGWLGNADRGQRDGLAIIGGNVGNWHDAGRQKECSERGASIEAGGLADPDIDGRYQGRGRGTAAGHDGAVGDDRDAARQSAAGPVNGMWADADWLHCRDGKWRPVEPGTFPLAHGIPERVVRLRGYGNAIVPQQAAHFIAATMKGLTT